MLVATAHKIAVSVAFVLLTAWLLIGGWQPSRHQPAETHATHDGANQNETKPNERGFWNWLTHDAAGFFTLWLVIVGGGQVVLFVWQLRLIKKTLAPAKDAADAARLNAQAVVDADRARIFVRVEEDNTNALFPSAGLMEGSDSAPIRFHIALTYTLKNHGKTPAIIKEISHQIIHADKLQKTRDYILVEPLPIEHVLDAGDRTERLRCEMDSFLTVGNAKSIKSSKSSLWFYGSVAYDDTFGWGRELRYVFNYDGDTAGRFRLCSFREFESQKRNERQKA